MFKALPSDPALPKNIHMARMDIREEQIVSALSTVTSPSTVAKTLRQRISKDSTFIEKGLSLYNENPSECPFCTQDISQLAFATISAYAEYFDDREAKERKMIKALLGALHSARHTVSQWQSDHLTNKALFDDLKAYFPSFSEKRVFDSIPAFKESLKYLGRLQEGLERKLTQFGPAGPTTRYRMGGTSRPHSRY